jgi:hypothetical protein
MKRFILLPLMLGCHIGESNTESDQTSTPPPEHPESLFRFADCEEAREYVVDATVRQVAADWIGASWLQQPNREVDPLNPAEGFDRVASQGNVLWVADGSRILAVDSKDDRLDPLSELDLDGHVYGLSAFGSRLIVVSAALSEEDDGFWFGTRVTLVDIARPEAPFVLAEKDYDGDLVTGRQSGGRVSLVIDNELPVGLDNETLSGLYEQLRELSVNYWTEPLRYEQEASAVLRDDITEALAELDILGTLPRVRAKGGAWFPAIECSDLYRPQTVGSLRTLSVISLDAVSLHAEPFALWAGGLQIHAGHDTLTLLEPTLDLGEANLSTRVHQIDLVTADYVASGTASGTPMDAWSVAEHEGDLHVATRSLQQWSDRENDGDHVTVLRRQGNSLDRLGRVTFEMDYSYSTRSMGDRAYAMSWDHVRVIDLDDPTKPKLGGTLYLGSNTTFARVDDTHLASITYAWDAEQGQGLVVSMVDVTDASHPVATSETALYGQEFSFWEIRSESAVVEEGVLLVPVEGSQFSGLLAFEVLPNQEVLALGQLEHSRFDGQWTGSERIQSIRRNGDRLVTLSTAGLKLSGFYTPDVELASLRFE